MGGKSSIPMGQAPQFIPQGDALAIGNMATQQPGLLELAGIGAKPPVGTPPFAPPHPQTGGAEIPTTAGTLPAKKGLAGFMDRLVKNGGLGDIGMLIGSIGAANPQQIWAQVGQNQQQRRREAGEAGQYQQRREDEFSDWQRRETWQLEHRAPDKPTGIMADMAALGIDPAGDEGKSFIRRHLENSVDPVVTVPLGGGQTYMGPRSGMTQSLGGGAQAPATSGRPAVGDVVDDPRKGQTGAYGAFKKAIIGQESGGRYGVANTEGSGALGLGQVMPQTARVLAGRLGLPYKPGLLAGNDPAARAYQDAITEAAVQEAWNSQGGDPRAAAMYYFGGSNRRGWGPKTRRYGDDILGRMRG